MDLELLAVRSWGGMKGPEMWSRVRSCDETTVVAEKHFFVARGGLIGLMFVADRVVPFCPDYFYCQLVLSSQAFGLGLH